MSPYRLFSPLRLKILHILSERPKTTQGVAIELGMKFEATYYHLLTLKQAGVVRHQRVDGSRFEWEPTPLSNWPEALRAAVRGQ